jgi:hypothetical protein
MREPDTQAKERVVVGSPRTVALEIYKHIIRYENLRKYSLEYPSPGYLL